MCLKLDGLHYVSCACTFSDAHRWIRFLYTEEQYAVMKEPSWNWEESVGISSIL